MKLPHDQGVRCVSFLDSGESLATGSYDRTVKVWKLGGANPGELLRPHNTLLGPEGTVGEIHSLREKGQIAVVSFDKTVRLYRLLPEQLIRYGPTRVTDKRKW
jgi:WD40 repeat protein